MDSGVDVLGWDLRRVDLLFGVLASAGRLSTDSGLNRAIERSGLFFDVRSLQDRMVRLDWDLLFYLPRESLD